MDKLPKLPPQRREDCQAQAQLLTLSGDVIATDITCKIYLPRTRAEMPYVEFLATRELFKTIQSHRSVKFSAEHEVDWSGATKQVFSSSELWITGLNEQYWGNNRFTVRVDGIPLILRRHREFHTRSDSDSEHTTETTFELSPNRCLFLGHGRTFSPTGIETRHYGDVETFGLEHGVDLKLDEKLSYPDDGYSTQHDDPELLTVVKRTLVAIVTLNNSRFSSGQIGTDVLELVKDFLLVASVATDCRTACTGWRYFDASGETEEYCRNFGFPSANPERFRWGLAAHGHQHEMIAHLWSAFRHSSAKPLLRRLFYVLVPGSKKGTVEQFLLKFALLEGLLQLQAGKTGKENTIKGKAWKTLHSDIQSIIKALQITEPDLLGRTPEDIRTALTHNIQNINLPSPRTSFSTFIAELAVPVADLWPAFGNKKSPGLYEVRNRLVHGFRVPESGEDALWTAEMNLHCLLTRMYLRVCDWEIDKSVVSPMKVKEIVPLREAEINQARSALGGLFQQQE